MATVTGLTAARTLMIEAGLIVTVDIDNAGHIVFTKHDGTTINTAIPAASLTAQGIVELATDAEVAAGTDTVRAVTPAGLKSVTDTIISSVGTKQPIDQDLTDISGLTPANNDFLQRKSGAWTNRTIAQVKTDLAYTKGDVSLGNVDNTSDANKPVSTATATAIANFSRNDLGIYVPPGWGANWKAKRASHASALATVAAVGSSSTQGLYSSNLLTAPWVSKIMTDLQTTYSDGGSGYFHTARSLTFMGASTTANAWNAISGNFCTVTNPGNWGVGSPYGPGANYIYTQTVGDTITFIIRGTKARIYTASGAGRSNWSYTVDGGSSTSVTDSGTGGTTIQVTAINGLSSGSHTIVMTKAGSAGTSMAVCGVAGEKATGIVVNNFGISGGKTYDFGGFTNNYDAGRWSGGPDYPADLLIYALGANDCNVGYDGDTYAANLGQFLRGVRDGSTVGGTPVTGATDIIILLQHIGQYDTNYKWQDYVLRARGIAEAYGAALVDMWSLGRNSWNYANGLGHWGTSSASGGGAGTDTIHMSDAGHTAVANALLPIIKAA